MTVHNNWHTSYIVGIRVICCYNYRLISRQSNTIDQLTISLRCVNQIVTRSKLDHKAWRNWFYNSVQLNSRGQKSVTFSYYSNSTQVVYRGVAANAPRLKISICIISLFNIATLGPNGPTQLSPSQPQLRSWGH